jgi:hypothetical protein
MQSAKARRALCIALAPVAGSLMVASVGRAQYTTYTQTFDNSSSFEAGTANYNPPPIALRFDYGGYTPTNNHSVSFSSTEDDTGNGGGSAEMTWKFNGASDGSESAAFTMDLFPSPGYEVTDISFNLMVGSGSAEDGNEGNGYFQIFTRDANYNDNGTTFAEELGDPTYSGSNDGGTWESINVPFSTPADVRALTFQDYNNGDINGNETLYLDNLSVTYQSVPEPASLGLLGIGAASLLARRRSRKA